MSLDGDRESPSQASEATCRETRGSLQVAEEVILNSLQEKNVLEKKGEEYFFEDPFFEKWFEKKLL